MKKIICLFLVLALMIPCFSGCSRGEEHILFVETSTGDLIRVSFRPPSGEYKMYATDDNMIYITTADGINILQAHFSTLAHVKLMLTENTVYYEKIATFERRSGDNYEYLLISTTDENTEYGAIGWVPGSNSAFLCASYLTKSSTEDLLDALHFNVKTTSQKDNSYYPLFINDHVYIPTDEEYEILFGSGSEDTTHDETTEPPDATTNNPVDTESTPKEENKNPTLDKETTNGE